MPKKYIYNCKFTIPNETVIELKKLKSTELLKELNTLLQTHYLWPRPIDNNIFFNLRAHSINPNCKRSLHPLLKKIIKIEQLI
tara:strand:- start:109 stop:357 length:249 start_codon:yes stop_codon:yes gene_type:complete